MCSTEITMKASVYVDYEVGEDGWMDGWTGGWMDYVPLKY